MQTVTLSEARLHLDDLVGKLFPGQEIVITNGQQPVARLLPYLQARAPRPLRAFAGQFKPLPVAEQEALKSHDAEWCEPRS